MPWIISVLLGALLRASASFAGRVLIALGFGFVEFTGISGLVDSVKNQASDLIGGVGSSLLADWAGFFRLDIHLSILISAIGVRMVLQSLTGGKLRRLVQK